MEDDGFGMLDELKELVTFEERQDLSQYSYDPNDLMENVNSDVALASESVSLPSSQEKLFETDYFYEESDLQATDCTDVDVLDLLGLATLTPAEQLPSFQQFENGDQLIDCKASIAGESTAVDYEDSEHDFDLSSPGTSSLPDSTTFFTIGSSELDTSSRLQQLSDDDLLALSTRDLNRRIRHMSHTDQQQIKCRRRTLKNRGYAQTCRTRRVGQRHQLEKDNDRLCIEIQQLTDDKSKLLAECDRLRKEGAQYKSERDSFQSRLVNLVSALAENGIQVQE